MAALRVMTEALRHRGPDDFGFCVSTVEGVEQWQGSGPVGAAAPGIALGHRRLSILDLSEAGRQPFASADRRYFISYNGEVYNYRELRKELEALGWSFRTHTDTEVVVVAYAAWGPQCIARFNGMWGFLLWDDHERTLFVARDRLGVKPLYFRQTGRSWIFASEVKAILAHPSVRSAVDEVALTRHLAGLGRPNDGGTLFAGVREVEAGTSMLITPAGAKTERYWELPQGEVSPRTPAEAADELSALLTSAVSLRLRSDVRVGTMLSGGLDSTSVISTVRRLMDEGAGGRISTGDILQAFTAVFPGAAIDEESLIDEVCSELELRAHKISPMEETDLESLLTSATWHMEFPYFNSVPMVHTLLMRRARSEGVKVVLNGHGADEMLAGYPGTYYPGLIGDLLASGKLGSAWREASAMQQLVGLSRKRSLLRAIATRAPLFHRHRLEVDRLRSSGLWRPEALRHCLWPERFARIPAGERGLRRQLREDFLYRSLPNWIHLEDRISMSQSVEARLPFLDFRLVEFVFRLPSWLKIGRGVTKRVLREAMRHRLPVAVLENRRKVPFSGPDQHWIRGGLRPWIQRNILGGDARVFEYLHKPAVRAALGDYLEGSRGGLLHHYQVWKLVNTEAWLRTFA